MKLLLGALAYLAVVGTLIAATFAGISSVERSQPQDAPVLARSDEESAGRQEPAREGERADPDRVPVWIAATPKYEYTPVPIDPPQRHTIIGEDALAAMAKAPSQIRREQQEAGRIGAPRMINSRRDNDPFFRD
jgi:hypothetical protein